MISIIISTYNHEYFKAIVKSIQKTIGNVLYEIVPIENHAQYSICEAYNIGAERAKFPFLCFVHEDIDFRTQNWGENLVKLTQNDETIGLVGVMGTKFKSTYPKSYWNTCIFLRRLCYGHGIGIDYSKKTEYYIDIPTYSRHYDNTPQILSSPQSQTVDVVCIDGMFLFTRKEIWQKCRFDEKLLNNFHGYDIDFSLQVFFASYRVVIDKTLLLCHYSFGNFNAEFYKAQAAIQRKWKGKLPVGTQDIRSIKKHWYNAICLTVGLVKDIIDRMNLHKFARKIIG